MSLAACGGVNPKNGPAASASTSPAAKAQPAAPNAEPSTAVLEKRALERWNLLIAHKAEQAYDYLTPGTRATRQRDTYAQEMNNRPVHWQ